MTVLVKYDHFKEAVFAGSATQVEYEKLKTQYAAIDKTAESAAAEFSKTDHRFIIARPGSYISAFLLTLRKTRWPLDTVRILYNALSPAIQKSNNGKEVMAVIREIDDNSAGEPAKDFTTTDLNAKSLSLSGFKGRYVLLDFWGSWCVPCR